MGLITLKQAREAVAEFAGKGGKCSTSDDVRRLVMDCVERLLHRGSHGSLRKWVFCVCNGCFTAPVDMDVPLKIKIDGIVERVWSSWYEFYDIQSAEITSFASGIFDTVGEFPTIYDMPHDGGRVSFVPLVEECGDPVGVVQGLDLHGREVHTVYKGKQVKGEYLAINRTKPVFSRTHFSKITAVQKPLTGNYVRLYWQRHLGKRVVGKGLLGEYRPTDTHPSFRRFRIGGCNPNGLMKVAVIGRIRLLDMYHDNEILPITSFAILRKQAQIFHAESNDKLQNAAYHDTTLERQINDQLEYKKGNADPFNFNYTYSPGSNKNLQ